MEKRRRRMVIDVRDLIREHEIWKFEKHFRWPLIFRNAVAALLSLMRRHVVSIPLELCAEIAECLSLTLEPSRDYNIPVEIECFPTTKFAKGWGYFSKPVGIVLCPADKAFFVTDIAQRCIIMVHASSLELGRTLAPSRIGERAHRPTGIAVGPDGNLVVVCPNERTVNVIESFAGHCVRSFGSGEKLGGQGVAVAADGTVAIASTEHHGVRLYTYEGSPIRSFGTEGAAPGQFRRPKALAWCPTGHLVVSDTGNSRLQVVTVHGAVVRVVGTGVLHNPKGVAVDAAGNMIVADSGNNRIVVFDSVGSVVWKCGGPGRDVGMFQNPAGVALMPTGVIAVVDSGNGRLQLI